MLRFENISKSYGHVRALHNASLEVGRGEIRGVLGGNGSGKSTLVKIAGGTVLPDAGQVFVDDQPVRIRSPRIAKRAGVVTTSQELSILPNLSVLDNMLLSCFPTGFGPFSDRKKAARMCMDMLGRLELGHIFSSDAALLPKNELYMLEFAKALIQRPEILMLDEITSALYADNVRVVKTILDECKADGMCILFITHRMEELYSICDTVTVMRNGEVIETCATSDRNETELLTLMVGKAYAGAAAAKRSEIHSTLPVIYAPAIPISRYGVSVGLEVLPGEIVGDAGLQGNGQSERVRPIHGLQGEIKREI
ncbi:MAG: ATP-binding cassette domain-containing protein, partial [Planctomycetes bacterium]|nr:ATP-binding cassette domain-containing protein [Planctomycetota bacterium]